MATATDVRGEEELSVADGRELVADDLLADRWKGYELIDGEPREKYMGAESEEIAAEMPHRFRLFIKGKRLGRIGSSNTGYMCFPEGFRKLRKPDTSFVRLEHLPEGRFPKGHCTFPPDIAVEVVSPVEPSEETMQKVQDFISVETPLVWVIYPETRIAMVFRKDGSSTRVGASDDLDGEDVLPGFRVKLSDVLDPPL